MRVVFCWRIHWALLLLLWSLLSDESESFAFVKVHSTRHRQFLIVGPATAPAWGLSGRRRSSASPRLRPSTAAFADTDPGDHHHHDPERATVNGERGQGLPMPGLDHLHLISPDLALSDADLIQPLAPPLSYDKFLRMQDKRVVVTIRYSGESGLRPYFLTVARKLKASHPDVVIERRILPSLEKDGTAEALFEILVDGKVVIGKKNRTRRQRVSMDLTRSRSVYVSMQELDVAISRARRRRRPTTAYGGSEEAS